MFVENGLETLVHYRDEEGEHMIALDDESYAHVLNKGATVIAEMMTFYRLSPDEADKHPELNGIRVLSRHQGSRA